MQIWIRKKNQNYRNKNDSLNFVLKNMLKYFCLLESLEITSYVC